MEAYVLMHTAEDGDGYSVSELISDHLFLTKEEAILALRESAKANCGLNDFGHYNIDVRIRHGEIKRFEFLIGDIYEYADNKNTAHRFYWIKKLTTVPSIFL